MCKADGHETTSNWEQEAGVNRLHSFGTVVFTFELRCITGSILRAGRWCVGYTSTKYGCVYIQITRPE